MARRTVITIVVLLALLALLFWYQQSRNNEDISGETNQTISVFNKTKNADATTVTASPKDELVYTLKVENTSNETISGYVVETSINDVSELATLIDAQNANYNASNNSLSWTPLDIPSNGSIEKQFTVRIKDILPENSDLMISTSYGNEVVVSVSRQLAVVLAPAPTPDPVPYKAPTAGPSAWFAFMLALAFTAGVILYKTAKSMNA